MLSLGVCFPQRQPRSPVRIWYVLFTSKCRGESDLGLCMTPTVTSVLAKKMRLRSTGWRRLIGSPKLQIIFHKRATKYRSLLQKIAYKDKGSYESSPPYTDFRFKDLFKFGREIRWESALRSRILCAGTEIMRRPRSGNPLHHQVLRTHTKFVRRNRMLNYYQTSGSFPQEQI